MRKKSLFLILFILAAMLTIPVSSVFAQDVDLSNMNNAELMQLLQAVMEKLEDAGSGSHLLADSSQQADESGIQESGSGMQEAGGRIFTIYENKKLILERLPDYMFYQPPTEVPEEPNKNGRDKDKEETKIYTEPTYGKPCGTGFEDGKVIYIPWSYCCENCPLTCGCG